MRNDVVCDSFQASTDLNKVITLLVCFALAMLPPCAAVAQIANTSGPADFGKIWSVALSQFNQSNQFANSLTQLSDGNLVAAGGDQNQKNGCAPNHGGAWVISLKPDGTNAGQKLYSTCATAGQLSGQIRATPDGGFVMVGEDRANPACAISCAFAAKLTNTGVITWQNELVSPIGPGLLDIRPTPDGYIAVGNDITTDTNTTVPLIVKLSSTGKLLWALNFPETVNSFPGAVASPADFTFDSVVLTSDVGYLVSGVAVAHFNSGFAHVLVIVKLSANGDSQWQRVYYSNQWGSAGGGESFYRVFQTSDGYMVTGAVETLASPFESLFLLMKLDSTGTPLWQNGYGAVNGSFNVNKGASAYATADGGYVLAGISDAFLSGPSVDYTGWMLKTDGSGNIQWQNAYTGTTTLGQQFNDVIETSDGGYAAAGSSFVGSASFGGPGFYVVKTDANGRIGTCSCVHPTTSSPQLLDLVANDATFNRGQDTMLSQTSLSLITKTTSVMPINLR